MITFENKVHYSRDLEISVLGICLLEPGAIHKIRGILAADMFYFGEYQLIYSGLMDMVNQAIPIDLITAADYFERCKTIPHIQNYQTAWYLCQLTNRVVSSAHLVHWAKILKAMWTTRELARVQPGSVKDLQDITNRLKAPVKNSKSKQYRFLLTYVDKKTLRPRLADLGARIITGRTSYKIRVSSPLLVFLMSVVEPQYTWTCGREADEEITNDQCKGRLHKNALFDGKNWIDKTSKIPIAWL